MPVLPSGRAKENFYALYPEQEQLESLVKTLWQLKRDHPELAIVSGNFLYQPNHGRERRVDLLEGYEAGFTQAYIDCHLDVYPSDLLMQETFRGGNLHTQHLWEIWQHAPVFQQIREFAYIPEDCKECAFIHNCKGGDISLLNLGDDYKKRNLLCPHDPVRHTYYLLSERDGS